MGPPPDGVAILDAHQHFWNLDRNPYPWLQGEPVAFRYGDYSALKTNFLPQDYRRASAAHRIVATVHIEAEWDRGGPVDETRWIEGLRREQGLPSVAVAHARLHAPDAEAVLAAHGRFPFVRGIRHKPAAAHSPAEAVRGAPGSMDDPEWRRGYALLRRFGFSFDLQTPWWHLDAAAALAADFPGTQIIINHAGLPGDRSEETLSRWRAALAQAARELNIALKVSGMGEPDAAWSTHRNGPVIADAVRIFGPERVMFGSNFPVDSLVASFDRIVRGTMAALHPFGEGVVRQVMGLNALRIYRIEASEQVRSADAGEQFA